jgi:cellulose synthase (UDP-forming)
MLPHHSQYSKYIYIINNPLWLKLRFAIAFLAFTLSIIGNFYFLSSATFFGNAFGVIFFFLTLYFALSYGIVIFGYKKFDITEHETLVTDFWKKNLTPTVDIFLPICGEKNEVLENTWTGVKDLDYKYFSVYVLDDKGDSSHRDLAEKFGFKYLSRQNKGEMKKAGNLKYGFEHSTSEFIVIFDADFRPHPDFLKELIPYTTNQKYGIIQSPQYFAYNESLHSQNFIEYGAGAVQEDFYKIIQQARNTYHGSICVGSNAIYRRSALSLIGGTAQAEHSEDVLTGFKLWGKGYETHYVPVVLAAGLCPETYSSYFKQQNRWCAGSMGLMRSKEFWTTKIPLMMRLCFISGMAYYVSQLIYFLLPLQIYLIIWLYGNAQSSWYVLWFIPSILNAYLIFPLFRKHRLRFGGRFIMLSQRYIFAFTVIHTLLLNRSLDWTPSGKKQRKDATLISLIHFSFVYVILLTVLALLSIYVGRINFSQTYDWFAYFWIVFAITSNLSWGIISRNLISHPDSPQQLMYK